MPSWSGSAAPSTLDDAGRALQGAVTREWNWRSYTLTATGTADAKVLSYSVAPAAYYNGQRFAFIANTTNTGSATLNVNSLGSKVIKKDVSGTLTNLSASEMVSGMFIEVAYNTANDCFIWVNRGLSSFPAGSASAPSIIPNGDTNTGFWFPAADTIAASTGGTESWRTDSSGNLQIRRGSNAYNSIITGGATLSGYFGTYNNAGTRQGYMGYFDGTNFVAVMSDNTQNVYFGNNGTNRFLISNNGDLLYVSTGGLGYGTGSGGAVTQITSKSTAVTLNKTNGTITTSNAALGAGATATFTVTNSTMTATDVVLVMARNANYSVRANDPAAGSFTITLKNESGGSLSDAVVINFAVIKAVTS
jgi:hypothetical protein